MTYQLHGGKQISKSHETLPPLLSAACSTLLMFVTSPSQWVILDWTTCDAIVFVTSSTVYTCGWFASRGWYKPNIGLLLAKHSRLQA